MRLVTNCTALEENIVAATTDSDGVVTVEDNRVVYCDVVTSNVKT